MKITKRSTPMASRLVSSPELRARRAALERREGLGVDSSCESALHSDSNPARGDRSRVEEQGAELGGEEQGACQCEAVPQLAVCCFHEDD